MTLHDAIIDDAATVFCNADDFAESVVYNGTRTINAVVTRDLWVTSESGMETPSVEVQVANDSTLGISSSEIKPMKDTITLAVRVGQTATARTIQRIISHDEGMLILECH